MRVPVLVALAALCGACLYTEPLVPGAPDAADQRLLGRWRCVTPEDSSASVLTVTQGPQRGYRALFAGGGQDERSEFAAYAARYHGAVVLNVQEVVDGEPRKWTVARYALDRPNILHVEFARDEPFREAKTQSQRLDILRRELRTATLFEDFCVCIRIKGN